MTTARTAYQTARMDGLAKSFNMDVAPAQQLSGPELDAWLIQAEDELFAKGLQDLKEMQIERQRGYLNSGFESR